MLTSYAQNFEDVLLRRALRDIEAGFYVDIGAQDPVVDSVSRGFYELGWRGIHAEATPHLHYALQAIHEAGCTAGLALNPGTPVAAASELLEDLDVLLCMTVNPGWGGQKFIPGSLAKIERLRATLGDARVLEVDGGIDARTARSCARAGATLFVAGSAVFGANDPGQACLEIARAIAA